MRDRGLCHVKRLRQITHADIRLKEREQNADPRGIAERLEKLRLLPPEHECWFSGRRIRFFHGRPVMDTLITAHHEKELIDPYFAAEDGSRYDVVAYADAHRQALRTMTPGIILNTGSVGNNLGEPKCCYAILSGEMGKANAPFEIRLRQLDYDREQAVKDAEATPRIANISAFIREVQTGIYSRPIPKK